MTMTRVGRTFGFLVLLVLGLGLGLRLAIAAHEWFIKDDFFLLTTIQNTQWSFRLTGAYRPSGLAAYFLLNFALFGWNALGYYVTALVLQALTGLMLVRIALAYGLDRRAAICAGVFVLLAGPSTLATYAVADHIYVCAAACYSVCLASLLTELQRPRAWLCVVTCAVLTLGLLFHEVCATFPVVALLAAYLNAPGETRRLRMRNAGGATWPYFIIAGLYVDYKLSSAPSRQQDGFYDVDLNRDVLGNLLGNLTYVRGGSALLIAAAVGAAALVWARQRGKLAPLGKGATAAALVGTTWLLATSLPFCLLAPPASRFALLQLPAAALLLALLLHLAVGALRPSLQSYALIAAIVLLTPWTRMLHALAAPRGEVYRRAHQLVAADLPASESGCVTVVCDGPGLASKQQCQDFRDGTYGGALWRALVPNRRLDVEFTRPTTVSERSEQLACLRYYLTPTLALTHEPPQPTAALVRTSTR